jgi:hypothetical protein
LFRPEQACVGPEQALNEGERGVNGGKAAPRRIHPSLWGRAPSSLLIANC